MKVINVSAKPIWIRLPGIPGAVVLDDPESPENKTAVGPVNETLGPGDVSREYPDLHRELLLSTAGLKEFVAEPKSQDESEEVEAPPTLEGEDVEVTPTGPQTEPPAPKEKKARSRRGRRKTK